MAQPVAHRSDSGAAGLPEWIRPQLTELVDAAPEGDQWLHEIKYDGYRMHARLDHGTVKVVYEGLREDKPAREVRLEAPRPKPATNSG